MAMIASSKSFSIMYRRKLLSPPPALPVNRELPLCTSTIRVPRGVSFLRLTLFAKKSIWQSPMSGIKLIGSEAVVKETSELWTNRGSITSFLSPKPQFFKSSFQGVPKGGLEIQKSNFSPAWPSWLIVEPKAIYWCSPESSFYVNLLILPEIIKSALQVA